MSVNYADVRQAQDRIRRFLNPTPIDVLEDGVCVKLENAIPGHSFKIRGALNAVLEYDEALITASTGNFGSALAIAGGLVGSKVTVVVPRTVTPIKVAKIKRHGVDVAVVGESLDDAEEHARQQADAASVRYVSPYNDRAVIAGGGVVGLEILEQRPDASRIYVPTGGGGLVTGIAVAVSKQPGMEVIACCPDQSTAFMAAVLNSGAGSPGPSIADALVGGIEDECITVELARAYRIRFGLVPERSIQEACVRLLQLGWLAEPAAAVGTAVRDKDPDAERTSSVCVLIGSNVDVSVVRAMISE